MDAIQLIMGLFLTFNLSCSAGPAEVRHYDAIDYQVLTYECEVTPHRRTFQIWSRSCLVQNGESYQARPFLFEEITEHVGFYMNQFGELLASTTGGLKFNHLYVPLCGT